MPPPKDRALRQLFIDKLREANLGKCLSEDHKRKISQSMLGKTYPPEFGKKISERQLGRHLSPATRSKISEALIGIGRGETRQPLPPEVRLKISQTHRQHGINVGRKNPRFGKKLSYRTRQVIAEKQRIYQQNPEHRANLSEKAKVRWQNREFKEKSLKAILKGIHTRPTTPETQLIILIKSAGLPFKYTGNGQVVIGGLIPDFVNSDGHKEIIELYGCYWHRCPLCHPKSQPKIKPNEERKFTYSKYGFRMLTIWEHELLHPDKVVERVKNWMEQKDGIPNN